MNSIEISELLGLVLFFLIFGVCYGGMHAYLVVKVRRFLSRRARIALIIFCVLMVFSPFISRSLRFIVPITITQIATLITFTWLAWLFWFCCIALAVDTWNLAVRKIAALQRFVHPVSPRGLLIGAAILIPLATGWGLMEAVCIQANTVSVPILPPGAKPVRIVQITDVHLSFLLRENFLRRVLRRVEELRPDLLVCTGDLADLSPKWLTDEIAMLAEIQAPLGKFAILGNHEYYVGLEASHQILNDSGFEVLSGDAVEINEYLRLAGIEDRLGFRSRKEWRQAEAAALDALEPGKTTVFLKHRPIIPPESIGKFDLQISGHIHGGQIFPFGIIVFLTHGFFPGLHPLKDGSFIFVSRGAGTWGPPLRLLAPPEVNLILLTERKDTP